MDTKKLWSLLQRHLDVDGDSDQADEKGKGKEHVPGIGSSMSWVQGLALSTAVTCSGPIVELPSSKRNQRFILERLNAGDALSYSFIYYIRWVHHDYDVATQASIGVTYLGLGDFSTAIWQGQDGGWGRLQISGFYEISSQTAENTIWTLVPGLQIFLLYTWTCPERRAELEHVE